MLPIREVAKRLGVCTATVYKLCASGELPHVRILNAIRVSEQDVGGLIERRHIQRQPDRPIDKGPRRR